MSLMYIKPKGDIMREDCPTEKRFTKRVDYLKSGGVETWFWGEKYPEKQLVYPEMFAVLNPMKKSLAKIVTILRQSHAAKLGVVLLLSKKLRSVLFHEWVNIFWSGLRFMAFLPQHYCISGRELRRALVATFPITDPQVEQAIDCLCLFWEYDNAYRCRGQDLFAIINKEAFIKQPLRETRRVLDECIKRETDVNCRAKVVQLKPLALLVMCLPKYRKLARKFIAGCDFEKMKMDAADRYWTLHRSDYNIEGLSLEERMLKRHLMKLS